LCTCASYTRKKKGGEEKKEEEKKGNGKNVKKYTLEIEKEI